MAEMLKSILEQIRECVALLKKNDMASVSIVIALARWIWQLKDKTRGNFIETLRRAGINERIGRRYGTISENWDTEDRTPGSDLQGKLPYDLHKLEALCKLPLEKLRKLADDHDLFKTERNEVIAMVRKELESENEPEDDSENESESERLVRAARTKFDSFISAYPKTVKKLDAQGKLKLAAEIEDLFSLLRDAVTDALSESTDSIRSDDQNDEEMESGGVDKDETEKADKGESRDPDESDEAGESAVGDAAKHDKDDTDKPEMAGDKFAPGRVAKEEQDAKKRNEQDSRGSQPISKHGKKRQNA